MSNYAFSNPDSIMLGAGELYFLKDGDEMGYHHLGNISSFSLNTDVETIEKYGSMAKRRELMHSVESQVSITGNMTFNEYDQYNLMLATLGLQHEEYQSALVVNNQTYSVEEIPALIYLSPDIKRRFRNVMNLTVNPQVQTGYETRWLDIKEFYGTIDENNSSLFIDKGGGHIILGRRAGVRPPTQTLSIEIYILEPPDTIGKLDGMKAKITVGGRTGLVSFTSSDGMSKQLLLTSGLLITFSVGANTTFTPTLVTTPLYGEYIIPMSEFEPTRDYIATDADARLGIVRVPKRSRIKKKQNLLVSYFLPEYTFKQLYGGMEKEINGQLVFVSDPNVGNQVTIECHKVRLMPEGDLGGWVSQDFGEYNVKMVLFADYLNYPESPFYTITYNGYSNEVMSSSVYNSKY